MLTRVAEALYAHNDESEFGCRAAPSRWEDGKLFGVTLNLSVAPWDFELFLTAADAQNLADALAHCVQPPPFAPDPLRDDDFERAMRAEADAYFRAHGGDC